ncbi:hypothetical protein SNE40_023388 [Patella caerulea]|uniref:Uncharacterized protein n=1 Tax=Patella caerulea TaxID=87958 RepID=A0AAN8GGC8_PATCE
MLKIEYVALGQKPPELEHQVIPDMGIELVDLAEMTRQNGYESEEDSGPETDTEVVPDTELDSENKETFV